MNDIVLYPDQAELMAALQQEARRSKSILLQSPTGSGKTAMMLWLAKQTIKKNKRVLFSVPRKDLLTQTSLSFSKYDLPHGFCAAGKDYDPFRSVYICMVETMARKLKKWEDAKRAGPCPIPIVQLAIFDETHFGERALSSLIAFYKSIGAWIIGPSATPWKMNGQGMGMYYDSMVMGKSVRWLIDHKRLSDYKYFYGQKDGELLNLQKASEKEINEYMKQKKQIIGDAVRDYKLRCEGKLHIVRCTSIEHSEITAEGFRERGVIARHIDGNTPDDEKTAIFKAFAKREINVLTFAQLLNFGFDLAQITGMDCCVESASDLRPSGSLAAQMQFWGRSMRYKPYPAIFNDHVNNWIKHGLPCSEREWTLESLVKNSKKEPIPPTKQCPKCFFVSSPRPSCPECGHVFEVNSNFTGQVEGELVEIDREEIERKRLAKQEQGMAKTLDELIEIGKRRGYKKAEKWALNVWNSPSRIAKRERENQLQNA